MRRLKAITMNVDADGGGLKVRALQQYHVVDRLQVGDEVLWIDDRGSSGDVYRLVVEEVTYKATHIEYVLTEP